MPVRNDPPTGPLRRSPRRPAPVVDRLVPLRQRLAELRERNIEVRRYRNPLRRPIPNGHPSGPQEQRPNDENVAPGVGMDEASTLTLTTRFRL